MYRHTEGSGTDYSLSQSPSSRCPSVPHREAPVTVSAKASSDRIALLILLCQISPERLTSESLEPTAPISTKGVIALPSCWIALVTATWGWACSTWGPGPGGLGCKSTFLRVRDGGGVINATTHVY